MPKFSVGAALSAAANPEVPSGRLASCLHVPPLLPARAQHPATPGLHDRAGGVRPGRSVWSLCPVGHRDAAVGHGCTSTPGAEQNLGSTSSVAGPGWRFALLRAESGEAVGLKQSSCSASVPTARNHNCRAQLLDLAAEQLLSEGWSKKPGTAAPHPTPLFTYKQVKHPCCL